MAKTRTKRMTRSSARTTRVKVRSAKTSVKRTERTVSLSNLVDRVFIVIPAYNEAKVISSVLSDLKSAGWTNIIVIDDCSRDNTFEIVRKHDVFLLRHAVNRGQGASLQTGIDFALHRGAQIIVTFDSDGQHCVEEIHRIIKPIIDGRADVALGSRFLGSASNIPFVKKVVLRIGILFTWVFSGVLLTDTHNGFRAFSRRAAKKIEIRQDRMEHASEIIDEIYKKRIKFVEVPVTIRYTEYSIKHGQNPFNSVAIALRLIIRKILQ